MKRVVAALAAMSLILVGGALRPPPRWLVPRIAVAGRHSEAGGGVIQAFGRLPLAFEPNEGQTDVRVRFLARGPGYTLFLTPGGAVLSLREASSIEAAAGRRGGPSTSPSDRLDVLSMNLLGANQRAPVLGADALPGTSNYFIGNDPSAWNTGISNYARVVTRGVYPGVDLAYYGNQAGHLEYDFTVGPGADPGSIRLGFKGQRGLSLDSNGDVVLTLPGGELRQPSPFAYQVIGGVQRPVPVSFALRGGTVSFVVGTYQTSIPLVIDPAISYSTYIGGTDYEEIDAIAIDRFSNAYLFGPTASADFPILPGAFQPDFKGMQGETTDDFVAKLNPDGTALIYSTYLGGTGEDEAFGMTIDRDGNAYLAGPTLSADFPTTPGAFQETAPGGDHDGFVTKLNPTGSDLVFSTYLGGTGHDAALTPTLDKAGDVFVLGDTNSKDLPVTGNAYQKEPHGGDCTIFDQFDPGDCEEGGGLDVFVGELNPTGSGLIYLTYLGGSGDEVGTGLDVDPRGNAYVALETTSADFPVTPGAYQTTFAGGDGFGGVYSDNVVTKLNPAGSALVYSTYIGGSGDEADFFQNFLDVDRLGHAFLASDSDSTDFPTTAGAFQSTNHGSFDETVTELNVDGSGLIYSTYIGGSDYDSTVNVRTIVVRPSGDAYVVGYSFSTDFPTVDPVQGSLAGVADLTLIDLNRTGSKLLFSTYLGGSDFEAADLAVDATGAAYLAGVTFSTDYPVTPGAFQPSLAGVGDGIVTKIIVKGHGSGAPVHRGPAAPGRARSENELWGILARWRGP
jgi:hypothetical protein